MKKNNFKNIFKILGLCVIPFTLISCSAESEGDLEGNSSGKVRIVSVSGSTSVGPLMEKLSEAYEDNNDKISVEINQVGSSAGIKDTINEVVEIGMSSRELKEDEEKELNSEIIAYDGIAIITNKNNPVKNLSLEDVKNIYTGEIKNWNEIKGGEDSPIVVVSREDGSGTRDAFQEIVGFSSEELRDDALISNGNGSIKSMVEGNKNAIAFVSFEYLDDTINALDIDGVKAEPEEVINRNYKLSRAFLLVRKIGNEKEDINEIIDFILSEEGQTIVSENSLIPVK